jgi:hypothetical protein
VLGGLPSRVSRAWYSAIGRREWPARGSRVRAVGATAAFTQADVGTEAACLAFVNGAAEKFGRIDVLVNKCRHPQIREGRQGECGELEREPQRQPDGLRVLRQGGGSAMRRDVAAMPPLCHLRS